jgi:hypothetical protein
MNSINEATVSGQVAGYSKNLDPVIKRVEPPKETGCPACNSLNKLGSRVICGICGRKH